MLLCGVAPVLSGVVFSAAACMLNSRGALSRQSLLIFSLLLLLVIGPVLAAIQVFGIWGNRLFSPTAWIFVARLGTTAFIFLCLLALPFSKTWLKIAAARTRP
jgi:hypothetical protein